MKILDKFLQRLLTAKPDAIDFKVKMDQAIEASTFYQSLYNISDVQETLKQLSVHVQALFKDIEPFTLAHASLSESIFCPNCIKASKMSEPLQAIAELHVQSCCNEASKRTLTENDQVFSEISQSNEKQQNFSAKEQENAKEQICFQSTNSSNKRNFKEVSKSISANLTNCYKGIAQFSKTCIVKLAKCFKNLIICCHPPNARDDACLRAFSVKDFPT